MNIGRKRSDIINKMFSSYILSSILIMVSVPILEITDGIMLNRAVSPDALSMVALLAPANKKACKPRTDNKPKRDAPKPVPNAVNKPCLRDIAIEFFAT